MADASCEVQQDDSLQNLIDSKNDDGNLDDILDTIFTFYADFLNDDIKYQPESDSIQNLSSTDALQPSQVSSSSSSLEDSRASSSQQDDALIKSEDSTDRIDSTEVSRSALSKNTFPSNYTTVSSFSSSSKRQKMNGTVDDKIQPHQSDHHNHHLSLYSNENVSSFARIGMTSEQKQRLAYLIQVPKLLSQAVNSANLKQLREIVETAFLPNCAVRSTALPNDINGREHIIEFYTAVIRMIPDFILKILSPTINHRVITARLFAEGTNYKINDPSDYLFNHLKYRHDENGEFQEASEKRTSLIEQGKPVGFKSKSLMHLILNEEMTYVEKFINISKEVEISETSFSIV